MATLNGRPIAEAELDYRDDRDIAFTQVANFVRRIKQHVENTIRLEHAQAQLEGRSVEIDLSRQGIKNMIASAAVRYSGGDTLALGPENGSTTVG